jgi:eukaryotic-like serine/threonine-protein kinase
MSALLRSTVEESYSSRYVIFGEIASGGMASVHLARLYDPAGFSRRVAIKRLHAQYAKDPSVRAMFLDEARIASCIRHPNVVPTLEVISGDEAAQIGGRDTTADELLIVLKYVHGETLAQLARGMRDLDQPTPLPIVLAVMKNVLFGLHAAHEARGLGGRPLEIVHRDVSPQNVIVGTDGVARVLDFGIARAAVRLETTRQGVVKGKLAYMAPEQLAGAPATRQADIYSAAVLLWELVAGRRLFVDSESQTVLVDKMLHGSIEVPSVHRADATPLLDAITLHGLERNPRRRFPTAREMARALERVGPMATPAVVGRWVEQVADEALRRREAMLAELEGPRPASSKMFVVRPSLLELDELRRATIPSPPPRTESPTEEPLPVVPVESKRGAQPVRSGVARITRERSAPPWLFVVMGILLGFGLGVVFSAGARLRLMRLLGEAPPGVSVQAK